MKKKLSLKVGIVNISLIMLTLVLSFQTKAQDAYSDLMSACSKGDLAAVQKAIKAGADVNKLNEYGQPPLSAAVLWPDVVKLLLENGAKPDNGTNPPLYNAVSFSSVESLKILLEAGAKPDFPAVLPNARIATLEQEKAKGKEGNKYTIKALEELIKAEGPTVELTPLYQVSTKSNCAECIDLLVKHGADLQYSEPGSGYNYLHLYALNGVDDATRKHQNKLYYDYFKNNLGITMPDWFLTSGNTPDEMIKAYIRNGLDINKQNSNTTLKKAGPVIPLYFAITGISIPLRYDEVIIAFINNGADLEWEHEFHGSAPLYAARLGQVEVMKAIVTKNTDLNVERKLMDENTMQYLKGYTPLTVAAMFGKTDLVTYLLGLNQVNTSNGAHGFSYSIATGCAQNVKNKTVIYFAIESGDIKMVNTVIDELYKRGELSSIKPITINQLKQQSSQDLGFATKVTTTCFQDGDYDPYAFAKKIGASKEILDVLKSSFSKK